MQFRSEFSCHISMPSSEVSLSAVRFVSLPGNQGRLGVLPRHAAMLIKLKPGIVSVDSTKDKTAHFFVWGGVANIQPTGVHLLTEAFTLLDDLDPIVLDQQLARYQSDLGAAALDHEQAKLNYKIEITQAMLKALRESRHLG